MPFLRRLGRDQNGATSIEYGLIVALIAVLSVSAFAKVGTGVAFVMNTVGYVECQVAEVLCVMAAPH